MLTVQSLLDELDLELAAGADAAAAPVRWVHISELADPTPWLSGGELMLTTGIPLDSAAKQRAFIRILADRNLAGLGFGTGFNHKSLPKALVDEAEKHEFPLFEVPYSTPFIAITEKAFARLVNEHFLHGVGGYTPASERAAGGRNRALEGSQTRHGEVGRG